MVRRGALVASLVLLVACDRAARPATDPAKAATSARPAASAASPSASADPVLEALAKELDPGKIEPFWPTLPRDVREDLERTAEPPKDPAARVKAARDRLEGFVWDTSDPSFTDRAALRRTLEGVFLAEDVALNGSGRAKAEAAAVLERFFTTMTAVPKALEMLRGANEAWSAAARKILEEGSLRPFEMLGQVAEKMRGRHAATVLRAGMPEEAVLLLLRDAAQAHVASGDVKRGRALYDEFAKRKGDANLTAQDWAYIAWGHMRAEDVPAATTALENAEKAGKRPGTPRAVLAEVRRAQGDKTRLAAMLAAGAPTTLAARIARFDALRALGRTQEADLLLEALAKEAPDEARVRVRKAVATFERMAKEGKLFQGAVEAAKELQAGAPVDKEGDYWSLLAGVSGMQVMVEALPELAKNPQAGMKRLKNLVVDLQRIAHELAKFDAGRAAAILFLLDRLSPALDRTADQALADLAKIIRGGFTDAAALRAKYPDTADVDRIVYTFAMFHADRAKALDEVAAQPRTPAARDNALYLQRARTALTVASMMPEGKNLDRVQRIIEDVLPSEDVQVEAQREALLGDLEVLRARFSQDRAAWTRAASHYELAKKRLKEGRARVANNLGYIALEQGDVGRAGELFKEATLDPASDRRWIAYLNATLPLGQRTPDAARAVREMANATRKDGLPPLVLATWLAALSTDPVETKKAAKDALEDMAAPLHTMKPDTLAYGMESEGSFQIGLGLASRHDFHELASYAYASIWLMPKIPLGKKELEDLARK